MIDHFAPDGAEPREDMLRAQSGIQVIRGRDGFVTWIVKMHPEAAGFLTTAVDARTAPRREPRFTPAGRVIRIGSVTKWLSGPVRVPVRRRIVDHEH